MHDIVENKKSNEIILIFEPNLKGKIDLKPNKVATRSLRAPKLHQMNFETRVFGVDNSFRLPALCNSLGKVGGSTCRFIPEPEDQE